MTRTTFMIKQAQPYWCCASLKCEPLVVTRRKGRRLRIGVCLGCGLARAAGPCAYSNATSTNSHMYHALPFSLQILQSEGVKLNLWTTFPIGLLVVQYGRSSRSRIRDCWTSQPCWHRHCSLDRVRSFCERCQGRNIKPACGNPKSVWSFAWTEVHGATVRKWGMPANSNGQHI